LDRLEFCCAHKAVQHVAHEVLDAVFDAVFGGELRTPAVAAALPAIVPQLRSLEKIDFARLEELLRIEYVDAKATARERSEILRDVTPANLPDVCGEPAESAEPEAAEWKLIPAE